MQNNNLSNIRIVLVRTFHPGNIGSAARSMKTMGLEHLCLVNPKDYPSEQANQMAASAEDVLNQAQVYDTIADAVSPCTITIASTARPRGYDLPELSPEEAATMLLKASQTSPVALLFGPERMGLHNNDLQQANYRVTIAANPNYSSLNMAAAVQTLCYEIYKQYSDGKEPSSPQLTDDLPTSAEIELFHEHFEKVLHLVKFLRTHQGETLQRIRHLFTKAQLSRQELNILRGILSAIEKNIKNK